MYATVFRLVKNYIPSNGIRRLANAVRLLSLYSQKAPWTRMWPPAWTFPWITAFGYLEPWSGGSSECVWQVSFRLCEYLFGEWTGLTSHQLFFYAVGMKSNSGSIWPWDFHLFPQNNLIGDLLTSHFSKVSSFQVIFCHFYNEHTSAVFEHLKHT